VLTCSAFNVGTGHATANTELTLHLDHLKEADQESERQQKLHLLTMIPRSFFDGNGSFYCFNNHQYLSKSSLAGIILDMRQQPTDGAWMPFGEEYGSGRKRPEVPKWEKKLCNEGQIMVAAVYS
jgi:hypothetical protein